MAEKIMSPVTYRQSRVKYRFFVFCLWSMVYGLVFISCAKPLYKDTFIVEGTYLEVTSPYKEASLIAYGEAKRLQEIFNFYDSQSELSRLNNTYHVPFLLSEELLELLKLSKNIIELTNGAFDPSYGRLYSFWKDLIKKGHIEEFPSPEEVAKLKEIGGMQYIEIDERKKTILIKKEGLKIDLGGIATGYIIDKIVGKLKEKGIDSALINIGGDIYCLGKNNGKPWKVGVRSPEKGGILETKTLVDEAITTSGNYEQFFEFSGKRYSHLIDPRSGYPVESGIVSVSVIAKDCTTADSLATGFFVMGLGEIKEFMARNPSKAKVFVVRETNKKEQVYEFK
jgi:thiamine biosynthesis lipoprotein